MTWLTQGRGCPSLLSRRLCQTSHHILLLPTCSSLSLHVPDSVVGAEANPLGNGTVLLAGLGQLLLGAERLERLRGLLLATLFHRNRG